MTKFFARSIFATIALIALFVTMLSVPVHVAFASGGSSAGGGGGAAGGGGGNSVYAHYIGKVESTEQVCAAVYYGCLTTANNWTISGRSFIAPFGASYTPLNGPIVVGACVDVKYAIATGFVREIVSQTAATCP